MNGLPLNFAAQFFARLTGEGNMVFPMLATPVREEFFRFL